MKGKPSAKILAAATAVIMTGCTSSGEAAKTTAAATSAESTAVSETSAETTPAETATISETIAETATNEESLSVTVKLEKSAAEAIEGLCDISDQSKRFCGWEYAPTLVAGSENEYYFKGGSREILEAAENAVRRSESFIEADNILKTAVLRDDGYFYCTVQENGEDTLKARFNMSNEVVDENGRAKVLFESAVIADFDGDGGEETFFMLTIPSLAWPNDRQQCAVFVNSAGEAQLVCSGFGGGLYPIRYRDFMHIQICFGVNIITTCGNIYAVENGKAVKKHENFYCGSKAGAAMLETMAQTPGGWLVVWDNIDKAYKYVGSQQLPDEAAEEIFNSPLLDEINGLIPEVTSAAELSEQAVIYGGKYISIGNDYWAKADLIYENGVISLSDERIIGGEYTDIPAVNPDLNKAEAECIPAPAPLSDGTRAEYTISSENVYYTPEEFTAAGGGKTLSEAESLILNSRYCKHIEHLLKTAVKTGAADYTVNDMTYTWDAAFFDGDSIKPLFRSGAYADFDRDGRNEAFLLMNIPAAARYESAEGTFFDEHLVVYVSSDGKAEFIGGRRMHLSNALSIISYKNEAHLLAEGLGEVFAVRGGVPVTELYGIRSIEVFEKAVYYDPKVMEYFDTE